ncbi:MAG: MoaD/ThiS family protein [Bacteroidia bacterium]|nr:MoaD/ThiS family protein [Bacteroidia bacterium]MCZ2249575.1 MoaD/ThiS family protein [Bacteroidia bacterium]
MICEVKYFGQIAEKLGKDSERIEVDLFIHNKSDLLASFVAQYPELKNNSFQIAVNGELMNHLPETRIHTIALLPPFAGG